MPMNDHELAVQLALVAGRLLMALRSTPLLSGAALGAAGDQLSNDLILRLLAQHRGQDGVMSEESVQAQARTAQHRVWIIDPLDGTREFAELSARTDWAVHVALSEGGQPTACAVALPAATQVFSTWAPHSLGPRRAGPLRIMVSRTRPPGLAQRVAQQLGAELLPMGSAGAKAMAVVAGQADAYLHAGGLSEWDSCAPVGVALAAGLHASRVDGRACIYNQNNPSMPDLLICRPECADLLLRAVQAAGS
jgi:3'(2'), 5'-bisphosphate nucleotidase